MRWVLIAALMCGCVGFAHAQHNAEPTLIQVYKNLSHNKSRTYVGGLVQMDEIQNDPGSMCTQMIGMIKVEGVQFSASGATLEIFRFTDNKGNQWSVPTNIGSLPNVDKGTANNFIRVGRSYFAHIQVCGSGGYASLINLYDPKISMGAFE